MIPLGYSASLTFVLPCFNTSLLAYLRNLSLCSVIVEALKVDSLQKLCSSLEPILRRVVSEEVERALAKLGPAATPARIQGRYRIVELVHYGYACQCI
jgi:hypothetical protein